MHRQPTAPLNLDNTHNGTSNPVYSEGDNVSHPVLSAQSTKERMEEAHMHLRGNRVEALGQGRQCYAHQAAEISGKTWTEEIGSPYESCKEDEKGRYNADHPERGFLNGTAIPFSRAVSALFEYMVDETLSNNR
jgi:hypothetical protein